MDEEIEVPFIGTFNDSAVRIALNKLRMQARRVTEDADRMTEAINKPPRADLSVFFDKAVSPAQRLTSLVHEINKETLEETLSLGRMRALFFDASISADVLSRSLRRVYDATLGIGLKFDEMFARTARIAELEGPDYSKLRADLLEINGLFDGTIEDINTIAATVGQMGVPSDSIASYTKQVQALVSVAEGLTPQKAAEGLGRISVLTDVPVDKIENLSSAIYNVAVNTNTSEAELLEVATSIATAGDLAGLSTQYILGLSGAMASLGIQAEAARGTMIRAMGAFGSNMGSIEASVRAMSDQVGVAEDAIYSLGSAGTDELKEFAEEGEIGYQAVKKLADNIDSAASAGKLLGVSSKEFIAQWKNAPEETFTNILRALHDIGNDDSIKNLLSDMGINAVRDVNIFSNLANNVNEV
jgi:propanediol dehydratase small subunit